MIRLDWRKGSQAENQESMWRLLRFFFCPSIVLNLVWAALIVSAAEI